MLILITYDETPWMRRADADCDRWRKRVSPMVSASRIQYSNAVLTRLSFAA